MKKNNMMNAILKSIGQISTPYKTIEDCPHNIDFDGPLCKLRINDEYIEGLLGLQQGQTILIMYWFENTDRKIMIQEKNKSDELKGTFALRSPHRPNPIGVAVLPIETIENGVITVKGLDCLDGTNLLDIKPAIRLENQ